MTNSQSDVQQNILVSAQSGDAKAVCAAILDLSNKLAARLDLINDTLNIQLGNLNQKLDRIIVQSGDADVF